MVPVAVLIACPFAPAANWLPACAKLPDTAEAVAPVIPLHALATPEAAPCIPPVSVPIKPDPALPPAHIPERAAPPK